MCVCMLVGVCVLCVGDLISRIVWNAGISCALPSLRHKQDTLNEKHIAFSSRDTKHGHDVSLAGSSYQRDSSKHCRG